MLNIFHSTLKKIFGILAHPAGHSLSPAMHNAAFQHLNIDAEFKFFDIPPEDLSKLFSKVREEKINGLAVSIPYKEKVAKYLDHIDHAALEIGAVNTIYWKNDKLCGTNTDYIGFKKSLFEKVQHIDSAIIFGNGGSARAVAYALKSMNVRRIAIWGRNQEYLKAFANEFSCEILPFDFDDIDFSKYQLLINTTPLGMHPNVHSSILPEKHILSSHIIFDLVMNPRETLLIKGALKNGASVIYGNKMLLYQGAAQFEIWHKIPAPIDIMWQELQNK